LLDGLADVADVLRAAAAVRPGVRRDPRAELELGHRLSCVVCRELFRVADLEGQAAAGNAVRPVHHPRRPAGVHPRGDRLPLAEAPAPVTAVTLDNGLRVLLLEDHRSPIVSLQLWYRVGSRNEARGATGIAHFLEHLMFRGTPTNPPGAYARIVERNGGQDN